jgi:hypothetical protein
LTPNRARWSRYWRAVSGTPGIFNHRDTEAQRYGGTVPFFSVSLCLCGVVAVAVAVGCGKVEESVEDS